MSTHTTDATNLPPVFAAQEAHSREWVTRAQDDGTKGLVLFNCADAMEQFLRLWLKRTGKPGTLWAEWYTIVEMGMEDACRLDALIATPRSKGAIP